MHIDGLNHTCIRTPSLLYDPTLTVLLTKNALRPKDCRRLNDLEMDDLFDNAMHSVLESSLCVYVAK